MVKGSNLQLYAVVFTIYKEHSSFLNIFPDFTFGIWYQLKGAVGDRVSGILVAHRTVVLVRLIIVISLN
jgi:hypothetical protein